MSLERGIAGGICSPIPAPTSNPAAVIDGRRVVDDVSGDNLRPEARLGALLGDGCATVGGIDSNTLDEVEERETEGPRGVVPAVIVDTGRGRMILPPVDMAGLLVDICAGCDCCCSPSIVSDPLLDPGPSSSYINEPMPWEYL
jgi:hypothetical protein